jgi:hypothetical protein
MFLALFSTHQPSPGKHPKTKMIPFGDDSFQTPHPRLPSPA